MHATPSASTANGRQSVFDFESLLGSYRSRALLRTPEIARLIGRSPDFVEREMDAGTMLSHSLPGRKRTERSATPQAVALWLASTADYGPQESEAAFRDLFSTMTAEQRKWAVQKLIEAGGTK